MRKLARIVCTFAGLALLAPSATFAQYPSRSEPAGTASTGKPKHRRGLFAREHLCAHCQAAKVMKRDGVYVPAPPAVPANVGQGGSSCTACGGSTAAAASTMMVQGAPVYAQQPMAPAEAPGVASVGPEPAAVGAYAPSLASAPARTGMPGTRDTAVMPSSMAETAFSPIGANRPHILSHLFGVASIGREGREARARRREEAHAAIPYGQSSQPVSELPARMVYGR